MTLGSFIMLSESCEYRADPVEFLRLSIYFIGGVSNLATSYLEASIFLSLYVVPLDLAVRELVLAS